MSKHAVATVAEPEVTTEQKTRRLPPYNVVILNDEEHTFPYVIEMLIKLFRHDLPKAEELTWRIHTTGRAIVYTTHKELAELKRDQVIAYGADPLSAHLEGPDALLRRAGAHRLIAQAGIGPDFCPSIRITTAICAKAAGSPVVISG